jgi:hypothetical protein
MVAEGRTHIPHHIPPSGSDVRDQTMRPSRRFVVTEFEGWAEVTSAYRRPGLSVHVLDTACNHRVVGTWRSEDYAGTGERKRAVVRHRAARVAAELNGEPEPAPLTYSGLAPTCPRCGRRADPDAAYCKCGKNLYRHEIGH